MKRRGKLPGLERLGLQGGKLVPLRTGHLVTSRLLFPAIALVLMVPGCQQYSGEVPPPDQAMKRALIEGKTPEQAASDYFKPTKIVDYFPEMDSVGQPTDGAKDWPDQLVDRTPDRTVAGGSRPKRVVKPFKLTDQEAFGRNAWLIWCAGNEGFWDWLANNSYGSSDLLKLVDSRNRGTLFHDAGLINEPKTTAPGSPEATDFGLWLNVPSDLKQRADRGTYLKQVFAMIEAGTYPYSKGYGKSQAAGGYGKATGAAGGYDSYATNDPPPEIYGLSSGVLGLRLFPNPNFDGEARKKWDANRYYTDVDYYSDPKLIRPFRVGMSCGFCHVSFHPLKPPRDITDPGWENISGNIGAQYLRIRGVFGNLLTPESFVYHVLDSQPPGTVDTSLIPSDNVNNTNAMNSIFNLADRVVVSFKNPKEKIAPASAALPSLWSDQDFADHKVPQAYLDAIPELPGSNGNPRNVPRILFDGADSIGAYGALSRVYLNIGSYWEQWIRIHKPLVGFRPQQPFRIDDCKAHSVYWNATQLRVGPMRDYFLRITPPMRLMDAEGSTGRTAPIDLAAIRARAQKEGLDHDTLLASERAKRIDTTKLAHGRKVFAHNCIVCHSSIQSPERVAAMTAETAGGEFWDHDPGRWLSDEKYRAWAEAAVEDPKFWLNNFLSTDFRIPINLVRTNSARAMATNAMADHMWSDFSSLDYQKMPSVGSISFFNPFLGENGGDDQYTPRHKSPAGVPGGGGPGFYRVPTLISIWTSAPLLHNNSLGLFDNDPSVDGRLLAFDDAIRKLLWPEKRLLSSSYNGATPERLKADHGLIWRTPVETTLNLPARQVPAILSSNFAFLMRLLDWFPWLEDFRWLWLPAVLIVISFVVLFRLPRGKVRAIAGYGSLVLALVFGFVIFFLNGKLGDVRIGPIPKGTPVNLLASINPEADPADVLHAIKITTKALTEAESRHLGEAEKQKLLREQVAPALMKVSKCPDFVMDEGHYYEWFKTMTDADKDALIELLKTF
jgi:mono/diheme cytochrome c family protein